MKGYLCVVFFNVELFLIVKIGSIVSIKVSREMGSLRYSRWVVIKNDLGRVFKDMEKLVSERVRCIRCELYRNVWIRVFLFVFERAV